MYLKYQKAMRKKSTHFSILFREPGKGESPVRMDLWNGLASGSLKPYSRIARSSTVKRIGYQSADGLYLKEETVIVSNGGGTAVTRIALYMHKFFMYIEGDFFY